MYFCRRRAATQATQTTQIASQQATQTTQTASQQVTQQATQTTQTVAQQATQTASQTAARQAVRTIRTSRQTAQRLTNWVILVTGILDLSDRELFNIDEFLDLFYDESDGSVDLRALEYAQRRLTESPFQSP